MPCSLLFQPLLQIHIHRLNVPSATKNLFEKRFLDFQKLLVVKRLFLKSTALGLHPLLFLVLPRVRSTLFKKS